MKCVISILTLAWGVAVYGAPPAKVLVLPFDVAGPTEKPWIAKAVQQNLMAELSRLNSVQPVTGATAAKDQDAALKAAQEAGADFVVQGTYQAVDSDLRLTGQVLDVAKKQAVAGLKSTGSLRDLFGLEDVIASQVKRALPQPVAEAKPEMLQQPKPEAPVLEPNGPIVMDPGSRLREIENRLDQAIDRLKYAPPYEYERPYYYSSYPYYYGSYYSYPIYTFPICRPSHGHGGHGHHGGRPGGGGTIGRSPIGGPNQGVVGRSAGSRAGTAVMGNYANFGRMSR